MKRWLLGLLSIILSGEYRRGRHALVPQDTNRITPRSGALAAGGSLTLGHIGEHLSRVAHTGNYSLKAEIFTSGGVRAFRWSESRKNGVSITPPGITSRGAHAERRLDEHLPVQIEDLQPQ